MTVPRKQVGLPGTVASVAFLLAVVAVVVWQFGGVAGDGVQIQVLNPHLLWVWRVLIVAVLVFEVLLLLLAWRAGRWTPVLAAANLMVNGLGAVVTVALLMRGDLLVDNLPQQLADVFDGNVSWAVPTGPIAAVVIVVAVWDSFDRAQKANQDRTGV